MPPGKVSAAKKAIRLGYKNTLLPEGGPPRKVQAPILGHQADSAGTSGRRGVKTHFDSGLVFVAMPFDDSNSPGVFKAISASCKSNKLRAKRVDQNVGSGFIILEVLDLIERAEFLIFDLSEERPNVYYELGFAHGVGNSPSSILLIARSGTKLHFDIAGMRVEFYASYEQLQKLVREKLAAMVRANRAS